MIGVTPREWVAAFYVVVGIVVVALLGFRPLTGLVILAIAAMTYLASRACVTGNYTYWRSLMLVASINLTGETLVGQLFVLPALALATLYSWVLAVTWLLGAREWPQNRWLTFLRGYRDLVMRMRPKE
jgi:glucan phosphoethanolaminetransferase (alkaline phosphatase superfamily)